MARQAKAVNRKIWIGGDSFSLGSFFRRFFGKLFGVKFPGFAPGDSKRTPFIISDHLGDEYHLANMIGVVRQLPVYGIGNGMFFATYKNSIVKIIFVDKI